MDTFHSTAEPKLPEIFGDIGTGELRITGRCIPEDAKAFFIPLVEWLDGFAAKSPEKITLIFDLTYFNTSVSKIILELIKKLFALAERHSKKFETIWYFEEDDYDMEETGLDYQAMVGTCMRLVSKLPE